MKQLAFAAKACLLTACLLSACGQPPKPASSGIDFNLGRLGVKPYAQAEPSGEIKRLEKIAAANPRDPEAQFNLGRAYAKELETSHNPASLSQAVAAFERVLLLAPGNASTLSALYNLRYRQTLEDGEEAFAELKNVYQRMTPEQRLAMHPPSLALFIYHYLDQRQSDQQDFAQLQQLLLDGLTEEPGSEAVYVQLAALYREQGYYPLALATLKEASRQLKPSADLLGAIGKTYEARAEAEGCSYERGNYLEDAIRYYKQAVPVAKDDAQIHYHLAGLFLDQNQPQLAMNEARILFELDAKAENQAFIAEQYAMAGDNAQALKLLEQSLQLGLSPSDGTIHEIYMYAGRWPEAASAFRTYLGGRKNLSVYDRIKADIISERSGQDLSDALGGRKLHSYSEWEAAIYAFWTSKLSAEQLQTQVSNSCQRTEFYFYSGYRDLIAGNAQRARGAFAAALQQNTYRFIERPLARQFLASIASAH